MKKTLKYLATLLLTPLSVWAAGPVIFGPNNSCQVIPTSFLLPQVSGTPATVPPANYDYLYFKSDDNLYKYSNAGVESVVSGGGGGTVTSVGLALPGSTFSVAGSPVINSGTLTGSFIAQTANTVFAGPAAAGPTVPTWRALVAADIPALPYLSNALTTNHIYIGNAGVATDTAMSGDATIVASGALTIANLAVTNAKIANATIDLTAKVTGVLPVVNGGTNSNAILNNNKVMVSSGGAIVEAAAITANRALASDASGLPVASVTTDTELGFVSGVTSSIQTQLNGKQTTALTTNHLLIGVAGIATDTAVSGDLSNVAGAFTVNTVGTSSAANIHTAEVAANAATSVPTASTIAKWDASSNMSANAFFTSTFEDFTEIATPANPAAAHLRLYGKAGDQLYFLNSAGVETLLSTGGTVTSVALTLPASTFSVAGSPVTSNGTLAGSFITQTANTVFAGPAAAGPSVPTWRSLVAADIPALPYASSTLTATHIFVGSAGNVATDVAMSGDVAIVSSGATTIQPAAVTLAKMANLAANSIIGNNTGAPATPLALTSTQVTAMLNAFTADTSSTPGLQGLVPAPASATTQNGQFLTGSGFAYVDQQQTMPMPNNFIQNSWTASSVGNQKLQNVLIMQNGNKTYAIAGGGTTKTITIYDVTDQSSPKLLSSLNISGTYGACGTNASWPNIFVPASGARTLSVINISDPTNPTTTGTFSWAANTTSIYSCAYNNGIVFMAGQSHGLGILDVGNGVSGGTLAVPVLAYDEGTQAICSVANSCKSFGVAVDPVNSIVYSADYSTSNPWTYRQLKAYTYAGAGSLTAPSLLQNLTLPANTKPGGVSLNLGTQTAFVTDLNQNLVDIVDLTNVSIGGMSYLSAMTPSATMNSANVAMAKSGSNFVYLSSGSAGAQGYVDFFDITNRSSPVKVASVRSLQSLSGVATTVFGTGALDPRGGYIYIGDYGTGAAGSGLDVFSLPFEIETSGALTVSSLNVIGTFTGSLSLATNDIFVGSAGGVATAVAMSGDASIVSSGALTVNTVGTSTAANIHSAEVAANAATSTPTASTISKWDASSNMSANAFFASTFEDFTEIATPANPAANHLRLYAKAGDSLYFLNSAGLEVQLSTGGGTVSSVALADGSGTPIYAISGSPVTTAGTLTFTLNTQTANKIFAGPAAAGPSQPTFRSLVSADIPNLDFSKITTGVVPILQGGTGQTTALAAFDALSPLTTKGDLIVYNGAHNVRVGVGTDTFQLLADSSQASGVNWVATQPAVTGSTGAPQNITAAGGIAFAGTATQRDNIWFVQGNGGPVTVTANPQIAAGNYVGQRLELIGTDDTNTVTLADGTGLSLNGPMVIKNHSTEHLVWDGALWVDDGRGQ